MDSAIADYGVATQRDIVSCGEDDPATNRSPIAIDHVVVQCQPSTACSDQAATDAALITTDGIGG